MRTHGPGRGRFGLLVFAALLTGCGKADDRPLRVVVVGGPPGIVDANRRVPTDADAVLMGAAAQGLVRLDAAGRIVPGLAERWSVSDDGLSYIFRLDDANRAGGARVSARAVVRQLRAAAAPGSRNPLAGVLTGIAEIVATNDVIEIRLVAPRPNLLQHLARPELGIVQAHTGTGPFRITRDGHEHLVLRRTVPDGDDERAQRILLEAARPALAAALFAQGAADLVLGGDWGSLPIVRAADPPAAALRVDPAAGLFGLAVADASGPLVRPEVRRALSMAIDRDALVAATGVAGLTPRTSLAGVGLSNLPAPAVPGWAPFPLAARQAEARRLLGGARPTIRVALPSGPGYRLMFAHLRRDWALIGVGATRVGPARAADLRLVDDIAPSMGSSWYLERFACSRSPVCDPAAEAALAAARMAVDPTARAANLGAADRALADAALFVPISAPVRWSLVGGRVTGFRANRYAVHSLADLVAHQR